MPIDSDDLTSEDLGRAVAELRSAPAVLRLECGVQHYDWGDRVFIPELLGRAVEPDAPPSAELWMGAHPELPSIALVGELRVPLDRLIAAAPESLLGPRVQARFGALPFLFKVLSAAVPLSIQAHPSPEQAAEGFAREEASGVPVDAPTRNYRDRNHKPELIVALTDFWALRGFRPLDEIAATLVSHRELRPLAERFEPTPDSLRSLYEHLMNAPQEQVDALLDPLMRRIAAEAAARPFTRAETGYWLVEADRLFSRPPQRDRGLLSVLLLNLLHLAPGDAIYLPAGVLHAYLEGTGIEIMANSNNVLRGGLTPKHVDVPELLRSVIFEGERPIVQDGAEGRYETPVEEFELERLELASGSIERRPADHEIELLLVTAGEGVTISGLELGRGGVALAPHGVAYELRAAGPATLYRASVPAG